MNHHGWTHSLCELCHHAYGTDEAAPVSDGVCCCCGHNRPVANHRLAPSLCRFRGVVAEPAPDPEPPPAKKSVAPEVAAGAPPPAAPAPEPAGTDDEPASFAQKLRRKVKGE